MLKSAISSYMKFKAPVSFKTLASLKLKLLNQHERWPCSGLCKQPKSSDQLAIHTCLQSTVTVVSDPWISSDFWTSTTTESSALRPAALSRLQAHACSDDSSDSFGKHFLVTKRPRFFTRAIAWSALVKNSQVRKKSLWHRWVELLSYWVFSGLPWQLKDPEYSSSKVESSEVDSSSEA